MTINDDYHSVIAGYKEEEERFRRLAIIRAILNPKRPAPKTPMLPGFVDIATKEKTMQEEHNIVIEGASHNGRPILDRRVYRDPLDDLLDKEDDAESSDSLEILRVCYRFVVSRGVAGEFRSAAEIAQEFGVTRSYTTQVCNKIADALMVPRIRDEETRERNREARERVIAREKEGEIQLKI